MSFRLPRRKPAAPARHAAPRVHGEPVAEEVSITDDLDALDDTENAPEEIPGEHPYPSADHGKAIAREEIDRLLLRSEQPTAEDMRRVLDGLRAWNPGAPDSGDAMPVPGADPEPAAPALLAAPTAPQPVLKPESAPGAPLLLAIGGTAPRTFAVLDGMPERRTVGGGKPVLHLGDDPANPGEAFAIGGMSDAWLDALVFEACAERDARTHAAALSAPQPVFTPRETEAAA